MDASMTDDMAAPRQPPLPGLFLANEPFIQSEPVVEPHVPMLIPFDEDDFEELYGNNDVPQHQVTQAHSSLNDDGYLDNDDLAQVGHEAKTKGSGKFKCTHPECVKKQKLRNQAFNPHWKGGNMKHRQPMKLEARTAYYANALERALKIDGNDKVFTIPEAERRKRQFGSAELADPRPRIEPPHSYGGSIREEERFGYTMPETMQAEMEAEEDGATQEFVADGRARLNLNRDGFYDAEDRDEQDVGDDEAEKGGIKAPKLHCKCGSTVDGYMVECTDCGTFWHPKCVDKGNFSPEEYDNENGYLALQADVDHFHSDYAKFVCLSCDNIFKSVLAEGILRTRELRTIKEEAKTEAYTRASERLRHHTEAANKYQVALKRANGNPVAVQAAKKRYAQEVERETKLNRELFGESDDEDAKPQKSLRFSTQQQDKNKGAVVEKVVDKKARVAKPRKTNIKTKHGFNAIAGTVLASNTTSAPAVNALRAKADCDEDESDILCDFCNTKILGLYYKCKLCTKPECDCCEDCAQKGRSHDQIGHTFEAKHARQAIEAKASGAQEPVGIFKRPNTKAVPIAGVRKRLPRSAKKTSGGKDDGDIEMADV